MCEYEHVGISFDCPLDVETCIVLPFNARVCRGGESFEDLVDEWDVKEAFNDVGGIAAFSQKSLAKLG